MVLTVTKLHKMHCYIKGPFTLATYCWMVWVFSPLLLLIFTGKQNFNRFYLTAVRYNIYNFMLSNVKICTGERSHLIKSARHKISVNRPSSPWRNILTTSDKLPLNQIHMQQQVLKYMALGEESLRGNQFLLGQKGCQNLCISNLVTEINGVRKINVKCTF